MIGKFLKAFIFNILKKFQPNQKNLMKSIAVFWEEMHSSS